MTTKPPRTRRGAANASPAPTSARGRPFPAGVSGNPGGRPKSEPHMRKRCRDIVDAKVIAKWEAEIDEGGPAWVKCSELLAAYGYGKPKDVGGADDDAKPNPLEGLTPEQIAALAELELPEEPH